MKQLKEFKFSIGGYFSPYAYFKVVDSTMESGCEEYIDSAPWPFVRRVLSPEELKGLSNDLESCGVYTWEAEYLPTFLVLDGTQWHLDLRYNGALRKRIYGKNAYPNAKNPNSTAYSADFRKLLEILNKWAGKKVFK